MRSFFILLACLITPSLSFAQGGVFEDLSPGQAVFIAKAPSAPLVALAVRLDSVCDETEKTGLALQIEDGLARIGVRVDPQSPIVLRYEVAPCETEIGRTPSLAQQDAFGATSRASELPTPPRQFNYKFGKRNKNGARLTLNMLVYKPGQAPLWNAVIAGRAPGQDTQDYLSQMAVFAFQHWGDGGEYPFELARSNAVSP